MESSENPWGYRSYRDHLQERFPGRVFRKLCLQAGFTCPNLDGRVGRDGCTFCNNAGFVPRSPGPRDLEKQWDRGRTFLRHRYRRVDGFIAYFQSFSNTYGSLERLRNLYDPLPDRLEEMVGMSISTRPDCINETMVPWLEELAERTFLTVELGLQSDRNRVLDLIHRGHRAEDFLKAVQNLGHRNFELCAHVVLGLPEEGQDAPKRMGRLLSLLPVQSIKIHNLHIMRGTEMDRVGHTAITEQDYLDGCSRLIACLRPEQACQRVLADAPPKILVGSPWCRRKQDFLPQLRRSLKAIGQRVESDEAIVQSGHACGI